MDASYLAPKMFFYLLIHYFRNDILNILSRIISELVIACLEDVFLAAWDCCS